MRILGIDPGTISTGIGVVDSISGELSTPYHSVIKTRKNQTIEQRLTTIYDAIEKIILEMDPLNEKAGKKLSELPKLH